MTATLLKSLFLESRSPLIRFLKLRGASADEAEDVVQELFIKLENRPPDFVAEPRAYLYRMADNLWLDRRRAAVRSARRDREWSDYRAGGNAAIGSSASAEEKLIAQQQLRLVEAALAALPERTVQIFRRFRIEGDRQKQIAADFGISLSAVEKHLQHAYEAVLAARNRFNAEIDPPRRLTGESEPDDS